MSLSVFPAFETAFVELPRIAGAEEILDSHDPDGRVWPETLGLGERSSPSLMPLFLGYSRPQFNCIHP